MSGFFGMLRTDGVAIDPQFLERMVERLRFRGPNGSQTWTKDGLGACFTYLETGTRHQSRCQPVRLGDRYTLLGEVRLDARKELISGLLNEQQPATSETSDQELLLLAWSAWGEPALDKLLGDFSCAIWDTSQQSLYCARDFAGARPFFYAWRDGVFSFGNTLNVLRLAPGVSDALDELFVRDFLRTGLCSDPTRTIWRDVRRLPAGHSLVLSGGQIQVRRFLSLPVEEPLRLKQPGEYLENYRELLAQAVGDRLPEGKTSLYLSGGLDSGSVCATAARLARGNGSFAALKAFTISWRPLFDDPEPEFAQLTARRLGLAHEILEENAIQPDEQYSAARSPEPTAELFLDRDHRFYQRIGAHARVVLAGDGGDDVLTGQSWPYLKYLIAHREWGEIVSRFGGFLSTHGSFPPLRGGFRNKLRRFVGAQEAPQEVPGWLTEGSAKRGTDSGERFREQPPNGEHPVHPEAFRALHKGYWASVHESEDAGYTGVPLETRAPLLDLRILRFLLRLPPVPWCIEKELGRRAMKGELPDEVLARPKAPLLADPLEVCWQKEGWRPYIEKNPPKMVHEFVKWNSWLATLERSKGYVRYEYIYPASLSLWLKAIEKKGWIQ